MDDLLQYYEQELALFRERAAEFAQQFPKIAGRLQLTSDVGSDPHVERLIQAFALIASRIHRKIDDEFPQFTNALLEAIYPHLARPVPARSIVQFYPDEERLNGTAPFRIEAGTELLTRTVEHPEWMRGFSCRFRTCYPVDLWPFEITEIELQRLAATRLANAGLPGTMALRVRLRCFGDLSFGKLRIERLRLHLHDDPVLAFGLYELLLNHPTAIAITDPGQRHDAPRIVQGVPRAVGFEPDEAYLDHDSRTFPGYRLLLEYFTFPDKFLFFDLLGLETATAEMGRETDFWILCETSARSDRVDAMIRAVDARTLRLACTPIVNTFGLNGEPIRLDHERLSYPVVADGRRPWGYEVLSVNDATLVIRGEKLTRRTVDPLYARHRVLSRSASTAAEAGATGGPGIGGEFHRPAGGSQPSGDLFWRTSRGMAADGATDLFVDLVDPALQSVTIADSLLNLRLTCSNRDLPMRLPIGSTRGDLVMVTEAPVRRIGCLFVPSAPIRMVAQGRREWQLLSHLALNRLSIVEGGTDALRGLLSVYNVADPISQPQLWDQIDQQIRGIVEVVCRPVIEPFGQLRRRTFCRGTEIEVVFDESCFVGSSAFLFAAVLEWFLALYAAPNSFVRFKAKSLQRSDGIATWPMRTGSTLMI